MLIYISRSKVPYHKLFILLPSKFAWASPEGMNRRMLFLSFFFLFFLSFFFSLLFYFICSPFIVLLWFVDTKSYLGYLPTQIKSREIVLVVPLESCLYVVLVSSFEKGESFSLWHIYLWKVDWWQVFSNVKCLCKLMMIIWYAMPCYYHVITMLTLLIFTWHLIYDCILWYWPCLYYFCIWSHCEFPVRKKCYGLKW